MGWMMKLAAMVRRYRGPHLRDLENRIAELELRLEVLPSGAADKPVEPAKPARRMVDAKKRKVLAKQLLDSGISQSETALRIGVSRQYISQLVHKGL